MTLTLIIAALISILNSFPADKQMEWKGDLVSPQVIVEELERLPDSPANFERRLNSKN